MLNIADVLAGSREYMEKHGWTRDVVRDEHGRVCSLGAIECFLREQYQIPPEFQVDYENIPKGHEIRDLINGAVEALAKAITKATSIVPANRIIYFNDVVAKDRQEVLDTFAKAEKIERAGFDPDA